MATLAEKIKADNAKREKAKQDSRGLLGGLRNAGLVMNAGLLSPNEYNAPAANRFKDSAFGLLGIVPGVGDAASAAESADLFNRGENFAGGMAALGALPLVPSLVGAGATLGGLGVMNKVAQNMGTPLPAGPARNQAGMIAYHGSPHKFYKFDMSKIGTGARANTEGKGIYLTSTKKGAKNFIQGKDGYIYKVDIPDKSVFADIDKPLKDQSDEVINAFRELTHEVEIGSPDFWKNSENALLGPKLKRLRREAFTKSGRESYLNALHENPAELNAMLGKLNYERSPLNAYRTLAMRYGGEMPVSDLLNKYGVNGFKMSGLNDRFSDQLATNYVLFDDQLPRILETNGQPTGLLSYADEAAQKTKAKK